MPQDTIIQYVKDRRGRRVGLMLARRNTDRVAVSWSKCRIKLDKFNRDEAVKIALDRIDNNAAGKVPNPIATVLPKFVDRASRYFKLPTDNIAVFGQS